MINKWLTYLTFQAFERKKKKKKEEKRVIEVAKSLIWKLKKTIQYYNYTMMKKQKQGHSEYASFINCNVINEK